MKHFCLFLVLVFTTILNCQEIENHLIVFPSSIYSVESKDSIGYMFTENGLYVMRDTSSSIMKIEKHLPEANSMVKYSAIINNLLFTISSDSLFSYRIDNLLEPILGRKWVVPNGMTKIFPFGEKYIFQFGTSVFKVYSITEDSLKFILDFPIINSSISVNYPYIIFSNANLIRIYKYSQTGGFYEARIIDVVNGNINSLSAGNDRLVYFWYYNENMYVSHREVRIVDLSDPTFPEIKRIVSNYPQIDFKIISNNSKFIHASPTNASTVTQNVYDYNWGLLSSYPVDYKVKLGNHIYFAFNKNVYKKNTLIDLNSIFPTAYAVTLSKNIVQISTNTIRLFRNNEVSNALTQTDSAAYTGSVVVSDSNIFIKNGSNYKILTLNDNKFESNMSFTSNDALSFDYFNDYIVSYKNNSFAVLSRNGNSYNQIFASTQYNKAYKSFKKDNSLFVVDSVKGVIKYEIINDHFFQNVFQRWNRTITDKCYSLAVFDNKMLIKEDCKLLLYDISDASVDPVILDSITIDLRDINSQIQIINNSVYVKSIKDSASLIKFNIIDNRLIHGFSKFFDKELGEYGLIGANNGKLILCGKKDIFWIKDTSSTTEIKSEINDNPSEFLLKQNYPNPFNPYTVIAFKIPQDCNVSLKVYDILGNSVATLVDEFKKNGSYRISLRSMDYQLPSGIYICRLIAGEYAKSIKMNLIK